jgi:hypothetical protein
MAHALLKSAHVCSPAPPSRVFISFPSNPPLQPMVLHCSPIDYMLI